MLTCKEGHPVVSNPQHEANNQRLVFLIALEVCKTLIHFLSLLLAHQKVLELELPSERVSFKMRMIAKYLKILEFVKACLIVGSLEVPIQNIALSPRPLFLLPILALKIHKKMLYFPLEAPEGSPTQDAIVSYSFPDKTEEAQGVIGGMIAAKVVSVLLVGHSLEDIHTGVICMLNQLRQRFIGKLHTNFTDITQAFVKDLKEEGVDGLVDLFIGCKNHSYYIDEFLQGEGWVNNSLYSTMEANNKCWTPGCGKPSTMLCPVCKQMDLDPSYFCNQECFKKGWGVHKLVHISREEQAKKRNEGFKFTGPLRPGVISKRRTVPEHIPKPDYYFTSIPKKEQESKLQKDIEVKSKEEIAVIRQVAVLARQALDLGHSLVKAGVTTDFIDQAVHNFIVSNNAYPSPLNYYKFPKSLCTSVNEVICHGIPDDRPLQNGDIVNLDVTVYKDGFHVDLNETYLVGEVAESSKFLVSKAYECLQKAIAICKPGTMYRQVGNVISKYIEQNGLSVNRTYCGHGIGNLFHCAPNVPHYGSNKATGFMKAGHVFTIEPMINAGIHKDVTWPDNWTAVTADGQRSAQFEHTLLITEDGCEVLTKRLETSPKLQFM